MCAGSMISAETLPSCGEIEIEKGLEFIGLKISNL